MEACPLRPRRSVLRLRPVACLFVASSVGASERFDHRGSIGFFLEPGYEYLTSTTPMGWQTGNRLLTALGATYALPPDGNEVLATAWTSIGGPSLAWNVAAGYRGYFGLDQVHTFFDLQAAAKVAPTLSLGVRFGFGVQYEINGIVGAYAAIHVQFGGGTTVLFAPQAAIGLQFRTYLFE